MWVTKGFWKDIGKYVALVGLLSSPLAIFAAYSLSWLYHQAAQGEALVVIQQKALGASDAESLAQ